MARSAGMRVAGGCDIYTDLGRNAREVAALTAQAKARQIDMAVVGDEVLLGNALPEDQLIGYINQVRSAGIPTGTVTSPKDTRDSSSSSGCVCRTRRRLMRPSRSPT